MVSMAMHKKGPGPARLARWRIWIQSAFALIWLDGLSNFVRMHSFCSPVFHCYSCPWASFACPIGVIANFSALHVFPFLAVGTLLTIGALGGTFVCGWVCPFGFLQDLTARLPLPKIDLPSWAGYTRYVVLVALVIVVPYQFGEKHPLFFCSVCPAGALEGAVPNMVRAAADRLTGKPAGAPSGAESPTASASAHEGGAEDKPTDATAATAASAAAEPPFPWMSPTKTIILTVFVVSILFAWRPWCTVFCPLGAIFSICNRFSFLYLRFRPAKCRNCAVCRSVCLHGGLPQDRVGDLTCVRCLECTGCQAVTLQTGLSPKEKD